ncbi:MAG: transposase [Chitinophagaceae bacterium]|nr:transposase [Chitinophagaceae bacterium]
MKFEPHHIYYVFNQGNNRQQLFLSDNDYQTFLNYTIKLVLTHAEILAYSLMPNHFHFQLHAKSSCDLIIKQGALNIEPLTNGIRKLISGYARIFNTRYERSGSLFRQKTKAKCLTLENILAPNYSQFDYCSTCFYYVHANAVAAGLVLKPEDWKWSSYAYYAGLIKNSICNKRLAEEFCGYNERDFKLTPPDDDSLLKFFL